MSFVGVGVGISVGPELSNSCVSSVGGVGVGNVNPVNFDAVKVKHVFSVEGPALIQFEYIVENACRVSNV